MKRIFWTLLILLMLLTTASYAAMTGREAHEKYLYPIVRVSTENAGGSGTIIYSKLNGDSYSNYVLTNFHVVNSAVKLEDEWDSKIQKNVKKERKSIIYVEIFKYKDLGTPVGTMKVEADLIIYNRQEDMALLKLRYMEEINSVAILPAKERADEYQLFDETIAVGCSLGFPPIATLGILTRKNFQIDSLSYHMSTSQVVYGISGGAIFLSNGTLIGIPSRVAVIGWSVPITHMGLLIPISRVYKWLKDEDYHFIFDGDKNEMDCLKLREEKTKKLREQHREKAE